jgi:hypothetical protein
MTDYVYMENNVHQVCNAIRRYWNLIIARLTGVENE